MRFPALFNARKKKKGEAEEEEERREGCAQEGLENETQVKINTPSILSLSLFVVVTCCTKVPLFFSFKAKYCEKVQIQKSEIRIRQLFFFRF